MLISYSPPIRYAPATQESDITLNTSLDGSNGKVSVMLPIVLTVVNGRSKAIAVKILGDLRKSLISNRRDNHIPCGTIKCLPQSHIINVVVFHTYFDEFSHDLRKRHSSRESGLGCFADDLCIHEYFAEPIGLAPTTGSTPPLQIKVCRHPANPTRSDQQVVHHRRVWLDCVRSGGRPTQR